MSKYPIGVFDSGYGGLTILKELQRVLPEYDYLYLGDNARAPYGPRPYETVYVYTLESVRWLFEQGCQLVILACNTASAKALRTIQQHDLPYLNGRRRVLGVIRPTAEIIGNYSRTGHIGILGTTGTITSDSYLLETNKFFPNLTITQEACPEWVELVEKNLHETPHADPYVQAHLDNILKADSKIDTLLLACTHYPLLINKIRQYLPVDINVVQQGPIVAESLKNYLNRHPELEEICSKSAQISFFTTGDTIDFDLHAGGFFGASIQSKRAFLNSP